MIHYSNLNGNSGVQSYEIGSDYIKVRFNTRRIYTYTNQSAGDAHIHNMKRLARLGHGLNSYINRNVKYQYEK